jgi:hypothetical protein
MQSELCQIGEEMPIVQERVSLPMASAAGSLCQMDGRSCVHCCVGHNVTRGEMEQALDRQTIRFHHQFRDRLPSRLEMLRYELFARGLVGVMWTLVLLLPFVGQLVRPRLRRRAVCAWLGYLSSDKKEAGCLLHPSRWQGCDVRQQAAFASWRGFGCGEKEWLCLPAWRWRRGVPATREAWLRRTEGMDWFAYSQAVKLQD